MRVAHNSLRLTNPWPSNSRSNWDLEMLIFEGGGKPENGARARTSNKYMTPGPEIKPGTHWWEASALTTAPTQLSGHLLTVPEIS